MKLFEFLEANTKEGGSWSIEFNQHKSYYETAEETILKYESDESGGGRYDFENPEMRQKSIDTNTIYYLQWYIHTPIGFTIYVAPTLADLERYVLQDAE